MSITNEQLIEHVSKMSVLDLANLVKTLEEKFGVSAAPVAVAGAAAAPVAEAQTEFSVVLLSGGDKKINVIKEVRAVTGLGLKEAKDLVEAATDAAPKAIKEALNKADAEELKKKFEAAGAKVALK